MHMLFCYLDCREAALFCYLVLYIEKNYYIHYSCFTSICDPFTDSSSYIYIYIYIYINNKIVWKLEFLNVDVFFTDLSVKLVNLNEQHSSKSEHCDSNVACRASSPLARLYSTSTMEHHHFDQCIMILNSQVNFQCFTCLCMQGVVIMIIHQYY
jgi:hypothetical protein